MINVNALGFSYGAGKKVLDRIDFDVRKGECVAVLGNNGAGKSTLVKCLNRILQPQRGSVLVEGDEVLAMNRRDISRRFAYVSQKSDGDRLMVFDAVLLGRRPYIRFDATAEDLNIVSAVITRMGLGGFELRYLDELSGGELQKVMLARALAQQPRVLMLDEPTSSLDMKNQYEVLSIVREIAQADGISVILVIHDLNLALRYCDRFLFVRGGGVYAYGGEEVMTAEIIGAVYGMAVAVVEAYGVKMVVPLPGSSRVEACPDTISS